MIHTYTQSVTIYVYIFVRVCFEFIEMHDFSPRWPEIAGPRGIKQSFWHMEIYRVAYAVAICTMQKCIKGMRKYSRGGKSSNIVEL